LLQLSKRLTFADTLTLLYFLSSTFRRTFAVFQKDAEGLVVSGCRAGSTEKVGETSPIEKSIENGTSRILL
jgi:hypothetical protein